VDLILRRADTPSPSAGDVEVVERKGLGHPDSICDGIAEAVCVRLCRHYLERFGVILHHNVDKVLLVGGSALVWLGGGEVTVPMEVYLAGRATAEYRGERIPIHELAIDACDHWLRTHISRLNVDRDVRIISRLRPGSSSLTALFGRADAPALANDTSCGVGFAPLTPLERAVLAVERRLNARETKRHEPAIGEDIKVMGVRRGSHADLTIACAIISWHVHDVAQYDRIKTRVRELACEEARAVSDLDVSAAVNAADVPANGEFYLTVTGTSAEAGDDGEVGRGNRASGLITPYRPMTMEAIAGKNPFNHVGKLYSVLANRIAVALVAELPAVAGAVCVLLSAIGQPVSDPHVVDLRLGLEEGVDLSFMKPQVQDIVTGQLNSLSSVRDALLDGTLTVL
jgi:S-adenosylmethionine synthetase